MKAATNREIVAMGSKHILFCLLSALFLSAATAQAQTYVGADLGASFNTVTHGTSADDNEIVGGFLLEQSLFGPTGAIKDWRLSAGLRHNAYGFYGTYRNPATNLTVTDASESQYLEIPLHAKMVFDAGDWRPYAFYGPNLQFRMSGDEKKDGYTDLTTPKSFGLSFDVGIGGEQNFTDRLSGFVQFEYDIGLLNISNSPEFTCTTRGLSIIFGALYRL